MVSRAFQLLKLRPATVSTNQLSADGLRTADCASIAFPKPASGSPYPNWNASNGKVFAENPPPTFSGAAADLRGREKPRNHPWSRACTLPDTMSGPQKPSRQPRQDERGVEGSIHRYPLIWLPPDFETDCWISRAIEAGASGTMLLVMEALVALNLDQQRLVEQGFTEVAGFSFTVDQIAKRVGQGTTRSEVANLLWRMVARGLFEELDLRDIADANTIVLTTPSTESADL